MSKLSKLIISFSFLFLFMGFTLEGQVYDRRGQVIYLELAGSGFPFSLNYETRFAQKTEGFGARIGVGYIAEQFSIPMNVNFLLGKEGSNHFLELGVGATYFIYTEPTLLGGKLRDSQLAGAFTIMYRLHPRYGKFFFKIGITPLVGYWEEDQEGIESFPMFGAAFGRAF